MAGVQEIFVHFPLLKIGLNMNPSSDFYPVDVKFPYEPYFFQKFSPLLNVESTWTSVSSALIMHKKECMTLS